MQRNKQKNAAKPLMRKTMGKESLGHLSWTFLTNHTHVLVLLSGNPQMTIREMGTRIGITERAVHRIVTQLIDEGYLTVSRVGRNNAYRVHSDRNFRHPIEAKCKIEQLISMIQLSQNAVANPRRML